MTTSLNSHNVKEKLSELVQTLGDGIGLLEGNRRSDDLLYLVQALLEQVVVAE